MPRKILVSAALAAASVLALAGCAGATPGSSGSSAAADGKVQVVASTNVYGDIAAAIGGDVVTVTSIITSAAQDPHSYEASAQDQLALSRADLVIENGGGYDPFIDQLLEASGSEAVVINAAEVSGLLTGGHDGDEHAEDEQADDEDTHGHIEGFNEHVWYSLHAMEKLAERIADELGGLDAVNAGVYEANYARFAEGIEDLEERAEALRERVGATEVAVTEPVALYLLDELGLVNMTPEEFTEAVEEGTDVPPLILRDTLALFFDGGVRLLVWNEQTAGPETMQLVEAARSAGIAAVAFTETLPEGADYLSWMSSNLDAISAARS
jgi:zinc/manganese transport system substrate-binding protein